MSARLSKTVILAGTVYRAGQEVSDHVAEQITAADAIASRVTASGATPDSEPESGSGSVSVNVNVADSAEVRQALDQARARIDELTEALAAKDAELTALAAQLLEVGGTTGPGTDGDPASAPQEPSPNPVSDSVPAPVDYSTLDIDALKAEIDKRNEGREGDDRISKRGSQETLAAALTADDASVPGKD